MRAGLVATAHKARLGIQNTLERLGSGLPLQASGVCHRTNDHKVIVHDLTAVHAMPGLDEFKLSRRRMHQQHVGIAIFGDFKGFAGAHGNPLQLNAGFLLEDRLQIFEQAGILRAGGGCHHESIGGQNWHGAGHVARGAGQEQKTG